MTTPETAAARRPVLLVVDDDRQVLTQVEGDLRSRYGEDYRIISAAGGPEAVDTVNELKQRGDEVALFLVDQRMPGVTGIELLERTRPVFPDAKRVLLTAYSDTQVAIDAINQVGLHHYLVKPWHPPEDKLFPVLDDLLGDWAVDRRRRAAFGGVRVLGHRWSPDASDIKDFLALNRISYRFLDIERDPDAKSLFASLDPAPDLPAVVFSDGAVMGRPDRRQLAQGIGLRVVSETPFHDLAIIGAGPAGLAAAVYAASEGLSTVVVERRATGGQAGTSSQIENYLGFPSGITGAELARRASMQAERFGAEIITAEATGIRVEEPMRVVTMSDGSELRARAVLITSGMTVRTINAPGYDRLRGAGVSYGATSGDGRAYDGEEVFVIGGANSAGQAALMFARNAKRVHLVVRGSSLHDRMSAYLVDQIEASPVIDVMTNTEVAEVGGEDHLTHVVVKDRTTGETSAIPATGLFIFVGAVPHSAFVKDTVQLDEQGFILTGPDLMGEGGAFPADWPLPRAPFFLEVSVPGVFAAGDVRHGSVRRVAAAVGSGSAALTFIHAYLGTV